MVIWEWLRHIVASTNRSRLQNNKTLKNHQSAQQCLCSVYLQRLMSNVGLLPADSPRRWPIKSNVQRPLLPSTSRFDINHWRRGVSSVTLSLSPTPLQNNTLANSVSGRAFTGHGLVTARRGGKKKKVESCMHRPAVIPLEVSLTAFLRVGEAKGKHVSLEEKKGGKWCWLWSLHCFSSSHE